MSSKAWVLVYLDENRRLTTGLAYGPDEEEDALEEADSYAKEEAAFLIELDLEKAAKEAGLVQRKKKAPKATAGGHTQCRICNESLPEADFERSPYVDICVNCCLQED